MTTPSLLVNPGGPGPVSNIPAMDTNNNSSIQSNVPTQLIIWGMVGFILVELLAVLCLVRYCCRARYVKKRKFKEREIILSDQTELYYADHKKVPTSSHYMDVRPDETIMVDDVRSIYSNTKPKLSTFELHLNIDKPKPVQDEYLLRYSTTVPKEEKYSYNGSMNRPVFEIISHADQRPSTPVKYETVKEFNLDSPNRNIRKKYDRSFTSPLGRVNYAYENTFKESGERVEWQTVDEIRTVDWNGIKKNSYSTDFEKDWKRDIKYDWKYSSFNDSYLNAYERLLLSNIKSKSSFLEDKPKKKPEYKQFDEHNITETDLIKKVIKDPDTDEILAVKTEVRDKSNISVIDVRYEDKIEEFEVPRLPPPLQFQQSQSIKRETSRSRLSSVNKKHENEDFLSSHEINIQSDAISISTNNQLDSPNEVNDYIKKLDQFETEKERLNFSELNKNFLDEIQNSVSLRHVRRESSVRIETVVQNAPPLAPPPPPQLVPVETSPVIIRKKLTDEDRQSVASSMNKSSAHLY